MKEKKTVQEALEWLLTKPDSAPAVAAPAKPAPKASYAQMAGGSSPSPVPAPAPLPSASIPVPRSYGTSEANVPVARPGHTTLPSPRFQSKVANSSYTQILNSAQEEEDYEKAIKQSLAETGNRDASGEPLDPNERKRQPGMYGSSILFNICSPTLAPPV